MGMMGKMDRDFYELLKDIQVQECDATADY
jgi:hypothetical protein